MDLRQVKYFLNLAETLNFTRAAELSQISQPSLTKAIRRLEDELGGLLVFRDGKDTRLTELGRTMRGEFEKVATSMMQALDLADQVVNEERTVMSIGIAATLGPDPIWKFIAAFVRDMTHIEVIVEPVDSKLTSELVLSGALDACFCVGRSSENPKLLTIPLFEEPLLTAVGEGHRFLSMDEIFPADLSQENYIDRESCEFRNAVHEHFMEQGILMRPQMRTSREDWVQFAISRGFGIAMLPQYAKTRSDIQLVPVQGMDISRTVSLLSVFGSATAPAIKRLRDDAKTYDWPA